MVFEIQSQYIRIPVLLKCVILNVHAQSNTIASGYSIHTRKTVGSIEIYSVGSLGNYQESMLLAGNFKLQCVKTLNANYFPLSHLNKHFSFQCKWSRKGYTRVRWKICNK